VMDVQLDGGFYSVEGLLTMQMGMPLLPPM
jgi:hypothetical protein